jgi:4-hydroxy-2-oxoheptanedioate aldolase
MIKRLSLADRKSRHSLPERLAGDSAMLALFSIIAAPEMVELVGQAGFDAVILDTEHGPYSIEAVSRLIPAARSVSLDVFVRVRANEPGLIGGALDAGADGVLVPQVGSLEAAKAAVAAARFSPQGSRGANPYVRAAGYGSRSNWFAEANAETAVMVMIEGESGLAALPDILDIPGLTGVFLGPVDLSHALGVPGQTGHAKVIAEMEKAIALAQEKGKAVAVFASDPSLARKWSEAGVSLVAYGVDAGHILGALKAVAYNLRRS